MAEVNREKLRGALELLPIGVLRDYIDERQLNQGGVSKEPLVETLVEDDWSTDEFRQLKNKISEINEERSPIGYYLCIIQGMSGLSDQNSVEALKEKLLRESAEFSEETDVLIESGFQIGAVTDDVIRGSYWTKNTEYFLDAFDNLRPDDRTYSTYFKIDLSEGHLYIRPNRYGKVKEVRSKLESLGLQFKNVDHSKLTNDAANDLVEDFVEELEGQLKRADQDGQKQLDEF